MNAVLFDLDGTLVDSKAGIEASVREMLRDLGHEFDPSQELGFILGPPAEAWMPILLAHYGDDRVHRGIASFRSHQKTLGVKGSKAYPGIAPLLTTLASSGISTHVATSKRRDVARLTLEACGLLGQFRSLHGALDDGSLGDKATLIRVVLSERRLDPSSTVMVGDRRFDMEGARANGITGIGALWGYGDREELIGAGAAAVAAQPADVAAILGDRIIPSRSPWNGRGDPARRSISSIIP